MNLKSSSKAFLAILASLSVLASFGCKSSGGSGDGGPLTDVAQAQRDLITSIQKIQTDLAEKKKVTKWEVSAKDIQADPRAKDLKLDTDEGMQRIQGAIGMDIDDMPPLKDFSGYTPIDMKKPDPRLAKYSTNKTPPEGASPQTPTQGYEPFVDHFKDKKLVVVDLKVTTSAPAPPPTEKGKPVPPPETKTMNMTLGPIDEKELDKLIEQAVKAGTKVEKTKTYPVTLYIGPKGKLAAGIDSAVDAGKLQPARGLQYYMIDVETLNKLDEARKKDPALPFLQPKQADIAIVGYKKKA